jgi:hypothetical protein
MIAINRFILESPDGADSKLFRDGLWTGTKVSGLKIERQFEVGTRYLLITSYDCFFEESNSVILLDQNCDTLSVERIGAMCDSYLLQDARPSPTINWF